jgi:molecular chaperone GrpE
MSHHHKHQDKPAHEATPQDAAPQAAEGGSAAQDASQPRPAPELDALRKERDDLMDRLKRVSADYVNYQKRVQREVAQAREFANETLVKELLPVLDDMERGLAVARQNHPPDDPLLTGMELAYKKALETLGRYGLTVIQAAGQPFDPEQHAALMQEPSADHPPQTVLKELQKGYQLKGRTIRPAHVVVSKKPDVDDESPSDG